MVFKMANKVEICGVNTAKLPLYKEEEMMEMLEKDVYKRQMINCRVPALPS